MSEVHFTFYKSLRYNSMLEIVWNILPILCLCWIAIPSFSLLYIIDDSTSVEFIVRIMGNQWYWSYEFTLYDFELKEFSYDYEITDIADGFDLFTWFKEFNQDITISQDELTAILASKEFSHLFITITLDEIVNEGDYRFKFDSRLIVEDDLLSDNYGLRLLEVDQRLAILQNVTTCFLISSTDVLHSWAVPSFGVKSDACPGRLNRIIVSINRLGVFYGQCSEICGVYHAFMPIVVTVNDSFE